MSVFLAVPIPTGAQGDQAPNSAAEPPKYPNTTDGLQQLLQAMLRATKSNDSQTLTALVQGTEVPNCNDWVDTMYAGSRQIGEKSRSCISAGGSSSAHYWNGARVFCNRCRPVQRSRDFGRGLLKRSKSAQGGRAGCYPVAHYMPATIDGEPVEANNITVDVVFFPVEWGVC